MMYKLAVVLIQSFSQCQFIVSQLSWHDDGDDDNLADIKIALLLLIIINIFIIIIIIVSRI